MKELKIEVIDRSIQTRYRLDNSTVDDYEEAMRRGDKFPPVTVMAERGASRYILVDGHHTIAAAERLGKKTILCTVKRGDKQAALHFALGANYAHGLRRTNADKRKSVMMAMNAAEYDGMTLREMGELCNVSRMLVSDIKQEFLEKDKEKDNGSDPKTRVRNTKDAPTQAEVDRDELREVLLLIKAFPYSGKDAKKKMKPTRADKESMRYVHKWLGEMLT